MTEKRVVRIHVVKVRGGYAVFKVVNGRVVKISAPFYREMAVRLAAEWRRSEP